ncbi:uncharacterized protein LOC133927213 [Phragmites australis]|uniref:uncharacterized protein LOC133927213 n=1 Tax=Phragmites australis TaxID=29695 RepID=UPI002D771F06|nr:uncharacterized protein LOC133927213 [Phragmites australis]
MQMKDVVGAAEKEGPLPHLPPPDQLVDNRDEEKGLRPAHQLLLAALEEMGNSQDNAIEGGNALVPVGGIEMGIFQQNLPVENCASSTATVSKGRNIKLKFDLKVSVILITISMIPLIDILCLHGSAAKIDLTLKLSAFFAFTAFLSAISLLFHTLKLMAIKSARLIPKNLSRASKILFAIGAASLFLTCISITYSLLPKGKAYYFLPLALLPSLLIAGFHFLYCADTDHGEISSAQSKARKKEVKRATQLILSLVSTSFSGFIGVVFAIYHKAPSLGAAYSQVEVPVYLLLGAGVAGILALLLCRMLCGNGDCRRSGTWQRAILSAANIVMIAVHVSAILMIAETILHGLLVAAVFPVVAGASAWLVVEFFTAAGEDGGCTETEDGKAAHGTMYVIAVAVASVSFGAILAIFGGLLGGAVGKEQLQACTLLLASAFVASVSLGVLTFGTAQAEKTKASTAFAATVLACCGLGTLVLAALALFYQIAA